MKTKSRILIFSLILMGFVLTFTSSCKKDKDPEPTPTPVAATVTDVDGNVYHTVKIGTQVWLVENLKTTKYRNGESIPNITNGTTWIELTAGAYCDYNNEANNSTDYGRLYNWYAVNDSRNIAPTGCHIATDAEWTTLVNYLGGESVAGLKLKEAGTTHWQGASGATNETGFTALPGGNRNDYGTFGYIGSNGVWWSSTSNNTSYAWGRNIYYDDSNVGIANRYKHNGLSVRCLKD